MLKKSHYFGLIVLILSGFHVSVMSEPLNVCLISGSEEYQSEKILPEFKKYLEERYNVHATLVQALSKTDIPGLEALEDCDTALFFTRRREIDGEQLERVKKYLTSGRPIVAVRTASHGFQNFLEFDKEVLGGNYHGHYKGSSRDELTALTLKAQAVPGMENHPVLKGVGTRITSRYSLYKTAPLAPDCSLIMTGEIPGEEPEPLIWTREYKGGRVLYCGLGGIQDFGNAAFRRMIANALFWTARRDVDMKPLPNPPRRTKPVGKVTIPLRSRVQKFPGTQTWDEVRLDSVFDIAETAIIVCDMWDRHWCQGATDRVDSLAPKMDALLRAARSAGIQIVHCPSDTINYYADWPQRRRMQLAPEVPLPEPIALPQPPLPIDDSDGGCDSGQKPWYTAWTKQHPGLSIGEMDGISDDGREVFNFFHQEEIKNIFIMGVHTNMCVLGRSFAIRPMVSAGMQVVLVRDLTDSMYNPEKAPFVSHEEGTQLVIEYIEKHYAPSTTSDEILAALSK